MKANSRSPLENGMSGLLFEMDVSTDLPIPECTILEYYITVKNLFAEPKEIQIEIGGVDILEAVDIADFSQPDPGEFYLTLTLTCVGWRQQLLEISGVQDSLFQEWALVWKQDALSLQTAAGSLPDTAQHEENHRIVAELLLDKLAEGRIQFDSTEVAALTAIASQCPLSGGDAVFEARALLGLDGFDDADLCNYSQSAAGRAEELPVKSGVLKALPNPSNGDFTLQLPYKLEKGVTARLNVFDQLGRLALTRIVPEESSVLLIDATSWPGGVYACNVAVSNGEVYSAIVVIEKQ